MTDALIKAGRLFFRSSHYQFHLRSLPICLFRMSIASSLWNKHTISHLYPKMFVISLSASFCSSIYKLVCPMFILRILSYLLPSILATNSAVSVTKLKVRMSPHFVPFVSFYNTITVTLATVCFIHFVDQSCNNSQTAFSTPHFKIKVQLSSEFISYSASTSGFVFN